MRIGLYNTTAFFTIVFFFVYIFVAEGYSPT